MKRIALAILLAAFAGIAGAQDSNWTSGGTAWTPYSGGDSLHSSPGGG